MRTVHEPPATFFGSLKRIGPSLIVTANIVGSGELIMTTALGASAGFVALWVILVSCAVKVVVQLEFGKHAIASGETTLLAFNKLPSPRWGKASGIVIVWLGVKLIQLIQYGGMVGGVALALNIAFPWASASIWACACGLAASLMVWRGGYRFIERTAIGLTATFSLVTLACAALLQWTPYRIDGSMIAEGLAFDLPVSAVGVALAAFGLTGVSADEIITYPYWCIEKGYASFTGKRTESAEWARRARGWIRVMYLDAFVSMLIYTTTTAAFYLLGASILHQRGSVLEGPEIIATLSSIYTETLGPGAKGLFLTGAVSTLFSSLFIACASSTRMFTDAFAQLGFLSYSDDQARKRWFAALAWILPALWTILYLYVQAPVIMVTIGGVMIAALMLLVAYAAQQFRYRRLPVELKPSKAYDILLWTSILAIVGVGARAILTL